MPDIWMISHIVQWFLLILVALALLKLRRQMATSIAAAPGRPESGPAEPLDMSKEGMRPGTPFPNLAVNAMDDRQEPLLGPPDRKRIILFAWPHCSSCEATYPYLVQFQEVVLRNPSVELIMITVGQSATFLRERFGKWHFRFRMVYVTPAGMAQLPVRAAPYGVVIDEQNVVRAATILGPQQTWDTLARAAGLEPGVQPTPAYAYVQ